MTLSDSVRLTRLGRDPRTVVTIDLPLDELVLISALCEIAFLLSLGTRVTSTPGTPGQVVVAPAGPHRTLDLLATRVYVALRRHAQHRPTLQQPKLRPKPAAEADVVSEPGGRR